MLVAIHEWSALKTPGRVVRAEADDLEKFVSGFVLAHPDLVAQANLGRGNLGGIKEVAEPQALGIASSKAWSISLNLCQSSSSEGSKERIPMGFQSESYSVRRWSAMRQPSMT